MDQRVNKSQWQPTLEIMRVSIFISTLTEYRHSSNKTCKAVNKQEITKMN